MHSPIRTAPRLPCNECVCHGRAVTFLSLRRSDDTRRDEASGDLFERRRPSPGGLARSNSSSCGTPGRERQGQSFDVRSYSWSASFPGFACLAWRLTLAPVSHWDHRIPFRILNFKVKINLRARRPSQSPIQWRRPRRTLPIAGFVCSCTFIRLELELT